MTNIGLANINDYVIDAYTENGWIARKWKSGFAECFGLVSTSATHYSGPHASFFYGYYVDFKLPVNLFDSAPKQAYSVAIGTGFAMPAQSMFGSDKNKVRFYALANLNGTQTVKISAHLWGTWK